MSQISKGKVALQGSGIRQRYPVFLRSGQASTIPGRLRSADSVARVPVDENLTIAAPVLVMMIRYQPGLAWSGS